MAQRRATGGRGRRSAVIAAAVVTVAVVLVAVVVSRPGPTSRSGSADATRPAGSSAEPSRAAEPTTQDPRVPTPGDLLGAEQIRRLGPRQSWRVEGTDANTTGNGIHSVCQRNRFADPDGLAALVRTFRAAGTPRRSAVQTVEVSRSPKQAGRGFRTVQRWYAGCRVGRVQLLDSYRVDDVGDQAVVLTLRSWSEPVTTVSVALARTRAVTTSTVSTTVGGPPPGPRAMTRSLSEAVTRLCSRSGGTGCVGRPTYHPVPPPPSGGERGILAVADLPPVGSVQRPWVGTRPVAFRADRPATSCDRAAFFRSGATRARTRTYLVPQARLPARFGLTETYGAFPTKQTAARFLAGVRSSVAGCEDRDLATKVSAERRVTRTSPQVDASAWDLTTEVSDSRDVRFRLGFVRVGRYVAQLTFTPSDTDDMSEPAYGALLIRAGDRLRELT